MKKRNKPSEDLLIAYLYGEIASDEIVVVEKWLQDNPEAAAEMEEMKQLQELMQMSEDQEVVAPEVSFVSPTLLLSAPTKKAGGDGYLPFLYTAAASFALLLIGAWLFGGLFHQGLNYDERLAALQMQINNQEKQWQQVETLATTQALEALDHKWTLREQDLEAKMADSYAQYEENLQESIRKQLSNSEILTMLWAGMAADHKAILEQVMLEGSMEQQRIFLSAIIDLETAIAFQRDQDLELIANSIDNVAIELDYRQQEAVNALAQLILKATQPIQNPN